MKKRAVLAGSFLNLQQEGKPPLLCPACAGMVGLEGSSGIHTFLCRNEISFCKAEKQVRLKQVGKAHDLSISFSGAQEKKCGAGIRRMMPCMVL